MVKNLFGNFVLSHLKTTTILELRKELIVEVVR